MAAKKAPAKKATTKKAPAINKAAIEIMRNASTMRSQTLQKMLDGEDRDINTSCKYPDTITPAAYHTMYSREGVAARVVDIFPDECWSMPPVIQENEDPKSETPFDEKIKELEDDNHIYHYLSRIDRLSGVGRFGVLLIGINDGLTLESPVEGINDDGSFNGKAEATREVLYLRPFEESVVAVASSEMDTQNPRFGMPLFYNLSFQDENGQSIMKRVHWHRVIHVADNREMSEVYGVPRMMKLYNRLMDIRKILSGSGEMFWKGAFPGISFEVDSDESGGDFDAAELRTEMEAYMNGLQRYLALEGVKAKSLAPQVANPGGHLESQLDYISIALGVPKRIFMGSERGELASSQDSKTWNGRLMKRQNDYLTPLLLRPFIDRLMAMGVLPYVEEYLVVWPDLTASTEDEKAAVADKWATAFSKYVAGDVSSMMPVAEFLSIFAGVDNLKIEQIKQALDDYFKEEDDAVDTDPEPDLRSIEDMAGDDETEQDEE